MWIVKVFAWVFGAAKKSTSLPPWVYQLLHLLVIGLITVVLGYFSRDLPGGDDVASESAFVRNYYYGILFFLFYLFVRLVIYVVRLFLIQEESEFPDIDEAWAAGMTGLAREGLDIQSVPIFLVMGVPEDDEASLFNGAKFPAKVIAPGPEQKRMPLRFYANRDALFISCSGASAICRQILSKPAAGGSFQTVRQPGGTLAGATQTPGQIAAGNTIQPGQLVAGQTMQPGQFTAGQTIQPGMTAVAQTIQPGAVLGAMARQDSVRENPPLSKTALAECDRRLAYVCQLLTSSRLPFCPINGLMLVVPLEWSTRMNQGVYQSVKQDLCSLHENLQLLFPVVCVFSGLSDIDGTQEFLQRSAEVDPRFGPQLRAGSHFPMGHPVDSQAGGWVINRGIEWFRRWVYSAFAKDLTNASNTRLYRMLCDLDGRRQQLANLLKSTFGDAIRGHVIRLAGCYFCGYDPEKRRMVFIRDVIEKLVSEQNHVAWSTFRILQDEASRKWAYAAYGVVGLLALADVWLLWKLLS